MLEKEKKIWSSVSVIFRNAAGYLFMLIYEHNAKKKNQPNINSIWLNVEMCTHFPANRS